ncbi:hypothetical protein K2X30_13290 [bacterium]|nr:hypothetical protein [bacterium]
MSPTLTRIFHVVREKNLMSMPVVSIWPVDMRMSQRLVRVFVIVRLRTLHPGM